MTPRIALPEEIIPGLPWDKAFRDDFHKWSLEFFGPKEQQQFSQKEIKPRKRRDMASILGSLDETFKNLRRGMASSSSFNLPSVSRSELDGLRKAGPLVFCPPMREELPFPENEKLPAHVFVAINDGSHATNDFYTPDFGYALKIRKPPWYVTRHRGQAWAFGLGWRVSGGEIMWGRFYGSTYGGKVVPTYWLCNHPTPIPGGHYVRREWTCSSWRPRNGNESPEKAAAVVLSNILSGFADRGDRWTVAVMKDGLRAKFLIDGDETAEAFADRSISAIASDGKRKRIIHYVKEHTQNRAGNIVTIPAHIRGLREFEWNGYKCFVTAPKFHVFNDLVFTCAADEYDDEHDPKPDTLDLSGVNEKLVALEDAANRRKKRRRVPQ